MKTLLVSTAFILSAAYVDRLPAVKQKAAPVMIKSQITRDGTRILVDNRYFKLRLIARTPEQIAAFYYARGFPQAMIERITKTCFITTGITNKTKDILWMDLAHWKFTTADNRQVRRFSRRYWFALWKKMKVPLRFQSTFRWTLIPRSLDYRPQEREGGNITLEPTTQSFTLTALFHVGQDQRTARPVLLHLPGIRCAGTTATKQKGSK